MPTMKEPEGISLFIGQIPREYTRDDLLPIFEPYGDIHSLNFLEDKSTGQHKGCAFLTYYTNAAAQAAQDDLHEKKTLPGARNVMQVKPAASEGNVEKRRLFCGMLSKTLSEEGLKHLFSPYGSVEEVIIIRTKEGSSKGCAFITYESQAQAQNAVKSMHHSQKMEGCSSPIVVKLADTNEAKMTKRMVRHDAALAAGNVGGVAYGSVAEDTNVIVQLQQQVAYYQQLYAQMALPQLLAINLPASAKPGGGMGALGGAVGTQRQSIDHRTVGSMATVLQNQLRHSRAGFNTPQLTYNPPYSLSQQVATFSQQTGANPVDSQQKVGPDGANLHISQIPLDYSDGDLMQLFTPFGNLISAKVFIDKATQMSKGFGFVSFENAQCASNAIDSMNGFVIGASRLRVQLKKKSKPY